MWTHAWLFFDAMSHDVAARTILIADLTSKHRWRWIRDMMCSCPYWISMRSRLFLLKVEFLVVPWAMYLVSWSMLLLILFVQLLFLQSPSSKCMLNVDYPCLPFLHAWRTAALYTANTQQSCSAPRTDCRVYANTQTVLSLRADCMPVSTVYHSLHAFVPHRPVHCSPDLQTWSKSKTLTSAAPARTRRRYCPKKETYLHSAFHWRTAVLIRF